jgi:hypothetical protein
MKGYLGLGKGWKGCVWIHERKRREGRKAGSRMADVCIYNPVTGRVDTLVTLEGSIGVDGKLPCMEKLGIMLSTDRALA